MFIEFPKCDAKLPDVDKVTIPDMVTIHQYYDKTRIEDTGAYMRSQLETLPGKESFKGKRICITVGSRGIPDLDIMVRTICDVLKEWGARPFIIPAMGSHAGATAEGQKEMIAGYNITEESMGVPILSSMDVVQYADLNGIPLYCDKNAMESDGIVILNKVKPHTDFRGSHESGMAKMMAIGIAKHKGAAMFHTFGFARFPELIPAVAEKFLDNCPFAFGVGVVQNAYDDICNIDVCTKENFLETDARLLEIAKSKIAKFKFDHVDLLIIDEIGKNISGNGYDPNITGRNLADNMKDALDCKKVFIRSLTPESHHNGAGLSSADVTLRKVVNDVDFGVTWTNALTTGFTTACRVPLYQETDLDAIRLCLRTCYNMDYKMARIVRIKNTLQMDTIQVSVPLYETIKDLADVEYVSGPEPMRFNENGDLTD